MADSLYSRVTGLESFTDADAATARIAAIYDEGVARIRRAFHRADPEAGAPDGRYRAEVWHPRLAKLETREVTLAGDAAAPLAFTLTLKQERRLRHHAIIKGTGY